MSVSGKALDWMCGNRWFNSSLMKRFFVFFGRSAKLIIEFRASIRECHSLDRILENFVGGSAPLCGVIRCLWAPCNECYFCFHFSFFFPKGQTSAANGAQRFIHAATLLARACGCERARARGRYDDVGALLPLLGGASTNNRARVHSFSRQGIVEPSPPRYCTVYLHGYFFSFSWAFLDALPPSLEIAAPWIWPFVSNTLPVLKYSFNFVSASIV